MGVFSHVFQVESANSLFTDVFIQALRRFVSRRGNAQVIRTGIGTNFAGASAEQHKAFSEINHIKLMRLCWSMVVNESTGKGVLLLLAKWEECGGAK